MSMVGCLNMNNMFFFQKKAMFSKMLQLHIFCSKSADITFDIEIAVKASASRSSSEAAPCKRERNAENGEDAFHRFLKETSRF